MQKNIITLEENLDSPIYDMSFDWFGKRIAIVTKNQKISIYKLVNEKWEKEYDQLDTKHSGPIWKIKWAHPSFGNIIATCSYDKTVAIWEEKKKNLTESKTWERIHSIGNFNDSVEDIKFAPSHYNFKLAAGCADGKVSVYSFDQKYDSTKHVSFIVNNKPVSSISWNKNFFEPQMMVIGTKASKDQKDSSLLTLWVKKNKWEQIFSFNKSSQSSVIDVSWGLQNGRSFHYIVSCGENEVNVWKFKLIIEQYSQKNNQKLDLGNENQVKKVIVDNLSVYTLSEKDFYPVRCTWNYMKKKTDEWEEIKRIQKIKQLLSQKSIKQYYKYF